jgi:hypothetical protein
MNEANATPHAELIAELMNPNNPKNEREHAAVREIEHLQEALTQPEQNLNCKSVQARLATAWGYVKAEQEPVAWRLVPIKPTEEMLKAMDECSTEGYDERLYAGHAASVYMAAVDAAPTPPQRKPLTHEQRFDLLTKFEPHKNKWEAPAILIDMVEAAHGIKENT